MKTRNRNITNLSRTLLAGILALSPLMALGHTYRLAEAAYSSTRLHTVIDTNGAPITVTNVWGGMKTNLQLHTHCRRLRMVDGKLFWIHDKEDLGQQLNDTNDP